MTWILANRLNCMALIVSLTSIKLLDSGRRCECIALIVLLPPSVANGVEGSLPSGTPYGLTNLVAERWRVYKI